MFLMMPQGGAQGGGSSITLILMFVIFLPLLIFSILYIFRSFKAFNAVLELNKKMDEVIQLLKK
jgi:hypothetical protein